MTVGSDARRAEDRCGGPGGTGFLFGGAGRGALRGTTMVGSAGSAIPNPPIPLTRMLGSVETTRGPASRPPSRRRSAAAAACAGANGEGLASPTVPPRRTTLAGRRTRRGGTRFPPVATIGPTLGPTLETGRAAWSPVSPFSSGGPYPNPPGSVFQTTRRRLHLAGSRHRRIRQRVISAGFRRSRSF